MKDPYKEASDILRAALEEIVAEAAKYREFEAIKLIGHRAAAALQDAEVCLREAKED